MIGVYDYTVILTYLSLLSGVTGMIIAMTGFGHPYLGMFCMMLSGLFDAFDGKVARTKKDRSDLEKEFGVQIDSFADLISFGVLPAAIGISVLRSSPFFSDVPYRLEDTGKLQWYPIVLIIIALFYVLAAMIRLAYFNATEDLRAEQKKNLGSEFYTGLPVTSAALVFPFVLLLNYYLRFDLSLTYFGVMLLMAVLFLANFNLKKPDSKTLLILVLIGVGELLLFLCIPYFKK